MDWKETKKELPPVGVLVVGWWKRRGSNPDILFRPNEKLNRENKEFMYGFLFESGATAYDPDYWCYIKPPKGQSKSKTKRRCLW